MSIIEDELALALTDPVRRTANNTKHIRSKAAKVSSGVPEVMAKVTGFGRGIAHVKAHLTYITRHGEIEMENESGQIFKGKEEVKELFNDWAAEIGESARRKNQRDTMHLVLSMPETVDSVSVHQAVREFTKKTFAANHDYVFALHTDTVNPHCHVTVKMRGHDGRALKTEKADLQAWRDGFAEAMQFQGVEATASPRHSRGVVKKAQRSVIRHIEQGDEKTPPRVSRIRALQVREVANEMIAEIDGAPVVRHPWEERIAARQQQVRKAWLDAAAALEQPKPIIVFKKEPTNGRPNYDQLDAAAVRRGQLSAGVYQSGLKAARRQEPAAALTRLRDVSGLPLVQSQGTTQMLLHAHARPDLGHDGGRSAAARDGVRRPGDRLDGAGGADRARGQRGLSGVGASQEITAAALAAQIKRFVKELPQVDTVRDAIRRELQEQLRIARVQRQVTASTKAPERPQEAVRPMEKDQDKGPDI
jgi:type IV secretory pathway VirD2 relaxase